MKSVNAGPLRVKFNKPIRFTASLGGFAANEIFQRTTDRLDTIHSEGVHRVSELCCFVVSQLLMLGKSVISNANKFKTDEIEEDIVKIDWPEDSVSKAKIIRSKIHSMSGDVEAVSNSFITGISDVIEAYVAAIQSAPSEKQGKQNLVQVKADTITNHLRSDLTTALGIVDAGLRSYRYVRFS